MKRAGQRQGMDKKGGLWGSLRYGLHGDRRRENGEHRSKGPMGERRFGKKMMS